MALHTTAITPATSVLKIRICGDSGSGTVSTLPRGTLIATYAGFPRNFNSAYHEPLLLGVPDQWSLTGMFGDYWNDNVRAGCMQEVPVVLAEELTVRRKQGHYWADVHASVVISGCSELMAMFDKDDIPTGTKSANNVFWAGSQLYVRPNIIDDVMSMKIIRSDAERAANPSNLAPGAVRACPLGTLVFPPNELSTASKSLYSNVYFNSISGVQLIPNRGGETFDHGVPPL